MRTRLVCTPCQCVVAVNFLGVRNLVDDDATRVNSSEGEAEGPTPIFRMQDRVDASNPLRDPFQKRIEGNQDMQEKGKELLGERRVQATVCSPSSNNQLPKNATPTGSSGQGVTAVASGLTQAKTDDDMTVDNVIPFRAARDFKAELMQYNLLSDDDFNAQFEAWFEDLTAPPPALSSARHLRLVNALEAKKAKSQKLTTQGAKATRAQETPASDLLMSMSKPSKPNGHHALTQPVGTPAGITEETTDMLRVMVSSGDQAADTDALAPESVEWIDAKAEPCDETGKPCRRVRLEWADGTRFHGYVSTDSRNVEQAQATQSALWQGSGFGVVAWKDGRRYEGDFKDGLPHGEGLLVHPEHGRFEGRFVGGKPIMRRAAQLFTPN